MRAAWLAGGAVATVIALMISTIGIWDGFARARMPTDFTSRSIPFEDGQVHIRTGRGQVNLDVVAGQAGELRIDRELHWSRERPTVTEDWDAETATLRLDAACPGSDQPDGPLCLANYRLSVPPETDLEARTVGGLLSVDELFSDIRVTSVSGDVRLTAISGDVWARTGTGDVDGAGLSGNTADVEVGSGDVKLLFTAVPSSVKAVVRTSGDVALDVPGGVYDVKATGVNTTVGVRRSATSSKKIVAGTTDGMVSVCCRR
ncbi:DUF4097 family beta strand repeat-containing protein [Nonomuraea sp. NPDC048882]|uniref:DUF4097 family beta strand repeat-containing protein n=1 Tax=unclassified Nonomuraea TaxID=2593643 RepID=UPI0034069646